MSTPTPAAEPDFAAFIGLDWADREHAWALQVPGNGSRESGTLKQDPEAIQAWAQCLAERFSGRPVALALEQSRGALLYALRQFPHLVLYSVHPSTAHAYRQALFPSGRKTDPLDADVLLDLLLHHRERLRPQPPEDALTRKLQTLVEQRRQLVEQRTAQTNRIAAQLKLYYPQVLVWFDQLHTALVIDFLQRWPTLEQLHADPPEVWRSFFHKHHSRSKSRIQEQLQQIAQATPALTDPAVREAGQLLVGVWLNMLRALNHAIQTLDQAIREAAQAHPDYALFASFPGAGPALTPRLLVAFGSCRDRFACAADLQSLSGIAPVQVQSGRQMWVHFRWACPKFLRQTFQEFAAHSIPFCAWARDFYQQQRRRGKLHQAALRALAYKWIRILFRCWQSRQHYCEELYAAARKRRAAPSLASTPTTPAACGNTQDNGLKKAGDLLKILAAGA